MAVKKCTKCGETKPLSEYSPHKKGRPNPQCKPCCAEQQRIRYHNNIGEERARSRRRLLSQVREYKLRKKYGLSSERFKKILVAQGGVCAICLDKCKSGRTLCVDHDHATGLVRGLLCVSCNTGLGHFGDSESILNRAREYLRGGARVPKACTG